MSWRTSTILAIVVGLIGCGAEPESDAGTGQRELDPPDAAGLPVLTPTEYSTSLQFLPLGNAQTRGISLQLASTATQDGLSLRYYGWELVRSGWRAILDNQIQEGPTRAPWRLFPSDSLRLTVTADGDPDAVFLRAGSLDFTLDLGSPLDRWEDRSGAQHEIQEAAWVRPGERVAGIVVQHRIALSQPELPGRFGPYLRAMLSSEDGAVIVLFHTREPEAFGDPFAWMYADGLTRRWTALEVRTVEVANSTQLRRNVPILTWFRIPEPEIRGELTAVDRRYEELEVETGPKPYYALYRVRGWLEFSGERRTVEGILELGEP
ncbi:MAG: hypothetical protein JSU87_11295 [Gemmatimonadota bacterium]|nr:MAG: hypothetical protein JSU87_11295 [Gemmatimonadota bacterium]